jgi:hypothetical protein
MKDKLKQLKTNRIILMNIFTLIAVSLLFTSCATKLDMDKLSQDEKAYIEKVRESKSTFTTDKNTSEEAWSRGHTFINRFSGMKIQSSTDYHVSTYNPNVIENGTIGYSLNKEISDKNATFRIRCMYKVTNFKYTGDVCKSNIMLMSYYMKTGKLMDKFVNTIILKQEKKKKMKSSPY